MSDERKVHDENFQDLENTTKSKEDAIMIDESTPLTRDGRQNRIASLFKRATHNDDDDNVPPFVSTTAKNNDQNIKSNLFAAYSHVVARYAISERRRRRSHQSKIGRAAMLIRDSILGIDRVENPTHGAYDPYSAPNETSWEMTLNAVSMICQKYVTQPWMLRLLHAALTVLIAVTFLEPPHWCRQPLDKSNIGFGNCEYTLSSKGIPAADNRTNSAGEDETIDFYYPSTNSMWFTIPEANAIETMCLCVVGAIVWMRIGRDGTWMEWYWYLILILCVKKDV
jgi:hypothetical protein